MEFPNAPKKVQYIDYTGLALRAGTVVAGHPFEYAKFLIQMGYEPFEPTQGKFFGKPSLRLPNIFQYLKYIRSVDGFFGMYRGLVPRLTQHIVSTSVYHAVALHTPEQSVLEEPGFGMENVKSFCKRTGWDIVCVTAATTASYPFHVITVRTMAQFVGREIKYSSLWQGIIEIYNNEGLCGFFQGFFPRLLADWIYVVISGTIVFVLATKFGDVHGMDRVSSITGGMVANSFAYQFQVVSTNVAVNQSGLALGDKPFAKKSYESWYDCWKTLGQDKQLSRGNSMFGRYYLGPVIVSNGILRPVGFHFGPHYSPDYGIHYTAACAAGAGAGSGAFVPHID